MFVFFLKSCLLLGWVSFSQIDNSGIVTPPLTRPVILRGGTLNNKICKTLDQIQTTLTNVNIVIVMEKI